MPPGLATFEAHRAALTGLAYRMLGDLAGAEEIVQEAWLRWEASTDNVDPQVALRYDVYVNGILRPESTVTGGTSTVAYAAVEGSNKFDVYAVDTAGNRSAPATVTMDLTGLCQ